MRLTFQLRFHTQLGQSLWLRGSDHLFRSATSEDGLVPLHFVNDQVWETTVALPPQTATGKLNEYNYVLRETNGSLSEDWGQHRVLDLGASSAEEVLVIDSWNHPGFFENAFYTEPFQQVLLKENRTEFRTERPAHGTHIFRVKAPLLARGQTLCLLGSVPELRNWDTNQPILLNRTPGGVFLTAEIELISAGQPIAYKYGVYDLERKTFLRYEDGTNRILTDITRPGKVTFLNDGFVVLPSNTWKGAGVSVPIFSLRSEKSFGVGEFTDLEPLVDWCRQTGLKLIQVLPVNDTTATNSWADSYPYSAISAFALHPMYLNLEKVAEGAAKELLANLEGERKRLNALEAVDYEDVLAAKIGFLKQVYQLQKSNTFKQRDYLRFFQQNRDWLVPYAVFCYFRDEYGTADFTKWPAHGRYDPAEVFTLGSEGSEAYDKIAFHCFVQYHLHRQLTEAVTYAHARGVVLKGDIPIGVYRYGADAWQAPELYCMDMQAGAPPDAFSAKGQNWGFPTYNWPRMRATGFA